MSPQLVGAQLRERRESLKLSIDHMAKVTNIRPRLLETFEESDYEKYPPKGYASGMLSSYARALGMDPRPILSGLEVELNNYNQRNEINQGANNARLGKDRNGFKRGSNPSSRRRSATSSASRTTGSMERIPGAQDTASGIARATSAIKVVNKTAKTKGGHKVTTGKDVRERDRKSRSRLEAFRESMADHYDDGTETVSGVTGSIRNSSAATTGRLSALVESTGAIPAIDLEKDVESSVSEDYELRGGGKRRPKSRTGSSRGKRYSAPDKESIPNRIIGFVRGLLTDRRGRMIVIAVVLILLVLVLIASLLLNSAGSEDAGILDVTGGNDAATVTETGTDKNTGAAVATVTTANGNPVVVSIDVAKGKTSLITVTYDDDKAFDGTAVGPWHRDFQVTQSFSAAFGTPSAVTVEENGNPIEIPTTEDGSGSLEISVQASGLAAGK